jgi:serine/threonine protein kinase
MSRNIALTFVRGECIADRYEVSDVIGVGGMGVVYSAVQRTVERLVAIKTPRPELIDDPYVRARFRAEAVAGARIDHPNVVRIVESGETKGAPFIVMEHVVGVSLADYMEQNQPFPVEHALSLFLDLLSALIAMHGAGVVHGDIKTHNVLVALQRDGSTRLKVIDLGLARLVENAAHATCEGVVSGTPQYLAPEVISGDTPTFASDQYAACVTLYELVAGVVPFENTTTQDITSAHITDEVIPLVKHRPDLPYAAALDEIIGRGLAKDPADRFPDVRALAAAVRALVKRSPSNDDDEPTAVRECRRTLANSIATSSQERIIKAYLELAGALVDVQDVATAVAELETAIALLMDRGATREVWRLQLVLSALHDSHGNIAASRRLARQARDCAKANGSSLGVERAAALLRRFVLRDRPTKRSRPVR